MADSHCYDFIVAGGGTAGCAFAGRLAEDAGVSVGLESGGGGRHPFITRTAPRPARPWPQRTESIA